MGAARRSGIALLDVELGEKVERGQIMGAIGDAVIALTLDPFVSQGDALVHLALADDAVRVRIDRGPEPAFRPSRRETGPH